MQLQLNDIKDKHVGKPCVIAAHGPSLNLEKARIIEAHNDKKIIRFSVNNWWDYFDKAPDYWILSTGVFTIERMMPIINEHKIRTFFSDDADFTSKEFIKKNIQADWLVYDQRHWQGKRCLEILKEFRKHFEEHKNFDFLKYGNNKAMWQPPRHKGHFGHCITNTKCCDQNSPSRKTLQETLQEISGCEEHYSTGDSVSLHAIAFAIIMGCNPIYVSGLDLDYSKGYANEDKADWHQKANGPNAFTPVRGNFLNDLNVLNKSAVQRGIKIFNLNPNPWYNSFKLEKFQI
jgi:hypothetical protein